MKTSKKEHKYRVSTQFKNFDFDKKGEAQELFERLDEPASLWKKVPVSRGVHSTAWTGIQFKRVRYGRVTYLNY